MDVFQEFRPGRKPAKKALFLQKGMTGTNRILILMIITGLGWKLGDKTVVRED